MYISVENSPDVVLTLNKGHKHNNLHDFSAAFQIINFDIILDKFTSHNGFSGKLVLFIL